MPTPHPLSLLADADITAAISRLFRSTKGVNASRIAVATQAGTVALTGTTDSLLSWQRAEEIVLGTRGVRGVVNALAVHAAPVPDQQLREAAICALADDPATSEYNVDCAAARGAVTLTGVVRSWAEKQLVVRVLRGVRGVRAVLADLLAIRADDAPSSDHKITTHVREVLDWDLRLTGSLVDVRTTEQVVHLTGTVGTAADQARVIAIAYQAGATRVDARDLVVAYWALRREIRPEKFAPRADEDVAQAVRDTCGYDPRVLATSLQVRVREGVVLLFGTVSTLRAKHAAEQDARNVVGVSDVHNLLRVRPTESVPDAAIRQATEEALARDPYVGWVDFTVRVQQGSVQLGGLVDSIFEQQQAENIAAGVNGAVEVDNQIEAAGKAPYWATNPHSDKALAEHIRRLYFWSASLYDQEVAVQVANGRVTLSGTVVSAADRQQAAFDAYEAGAREVNNHLRITAAAMPHSRSETTLTEAPHSVCQ